MKLNASNYKCIYLFSNALDNIFISSPLTVTELRHDFAVYQVNFEFDDNMSLKQIKLLKGKPKDRKRVDFAANEGLREREAQVQELCKVKSRLDSLRKRILTFRSSESKASDENDFCGSCVVYVPVAELKERA